MSRIISPLLLSACLLGGSALAEDGEKPRQIVLISFDGAHDNALWTRSREIAARTHAHFTYFLSCTFLMTANEAKAYQGPGARVGRSNIGFAKSTQDVETRLANIWSAHLEGHDIASHACGHFDGKSWTQADWEQEFRVAHAMLRDGWKHVGQAEKEPAGWAAFADEDMKGFRAPYLSTSKRLVPAEKAMGFTYDASLVTKGPMLPKKEDGIYRFGLPLIPEGPKQRNIIAMDYNLYVRHSKAIEDKAHSAEFEDRAFKAFEAAFQKQYDGERIPLQIGFHFVEMNAGAYWRALDRFATDVCSRQDVACVSYSQAIPMLESRVQKEEHPL